MAHPDLIPVQLIPREAAQTFAGGDEYLALTLLRRARDEQAPNSVSWAQLERLVGLVLIHLQREVEGTFALERGDAILDQAGAQKPTLAWLADPLESPE